MGQTGIFLAALALALLLDAALIAVLRRRGRTGLPAWPLLQGPTVARWGFGLALGVYLATRLIGLEDFPIYFFTDEAVQTMLASDFVRDDFHDPGGTPWPTYFENSSLYNLSLSVYLQVLPGMLLRRSIFLTRAIPALVTVTGAVALALILRNGFRARTWWSAPLLLAIGPAWFLHSRTAFETTLMVSFYAWFLFFYLMYLRGSTRGLYLALLFGALAFYSYSPGQLIVVATGLLLLLSDRKYHWRQWKASLLAVPLLALLALPYVRFQLQHPGETYFHLRMVGSHWFLDLPTIEKLNQSLQYYWQAINPAYWFIPHQQDLIRHIMRDYAFLPTAMLPLVLVGLLRIIRQLHSGVHRTVLLSGLAVPVGAAVAGPGITRVLSFVVPATVMAGLGLEELARRVRPAIARRAAGIGLAAGLTAASFGMLVDALDHGPTWFDDYGLYGMQYGARQVFGEIRTLLRSQPDARVVLSPVWANGTHILLQFFVPQEPRIALQGGDSLLEGPMEDLEQNIYVLTPEEHAALRDSSLFGELTELETLPYPDGRPGFYFLKLRYAPDAQQQFARQLEERRQPITSWVEVDGQMVEVEHSPLDIGGLDEIFDQDPFTLARTRESNPAILKFTFPSPRWLSGLTLSVSTMELSLKARLMTAGSDRPVVRTWDYLDLPPDPTVEARFWETPREVVVLTLEIHKRDGDALDKVHIYDLILW